MKKTYSILIIAAVLFSFSCSETKISADSEQTKQSEALFSEAQRQIGMPNIVNFQQRKLMKLIFELCDKEDQITYAYIKSDYQGKLFFIGKCIGYGLPFSAQFTSPEKVVQGDKMLGYDLAGINHVMTVPQADPNGLFMPTSSSATWLMMIDPKTSKPRPVYVEPEIVVSPFPLH